MCVYIIFTFPFIWPSQPVEIKKWSVSHGESVIKENFPEYYIMNNENQNVRKQQCLVHVKYVS